MLLVGRCVMTVATVGKDDFIHPNPHMSIPTTRSIVMSFVFQCRCNRLHYGIEPIEFNRHSPFAIRHSPFVLLELMIKHIRMDSKYLIRPFLLMIEIMINWSSIPVSGVP